MSKILIVLSCLPLYVINSFCDKYVSSKNGDKYSFLYNCLKFLIGSIILIPVLLTDNSAKFGLGALFCGTLCGVMYAVSKTVILSGYEKTSVAFMTLCHASGMILPCVIGHFFWNEKLSALSVVGIFLASVSIVLLKDGKADKKKFDIAGIIIGAVIFVTSGGVMITQKLMGIYFAGQSVGAYNFYSFVAAFLILSFFARSQIKTRKNTKFILLCAVGSAISLCIISLVMTKLAGSVPSIILFPLFNGLGIILVCIGSVFAFKEKLTIRKIIGLVFGVCGLCLVNF